jgi:CBS domain-containing protein/sporulation protein YlmC with PRC-barrel domain
MNQRDYPARLRVEPVPRSQRLSQLIGRPVVDSNGEPVGPLTDVVVRLRSGGYPPVVGLLVRVGRDAVFVPIESVGELDEEPLGLRYLRTDFQTFHRGDDEVSLGAEVLRHRLIEVVTARFVRAYDISLGRNDQGWSVCGVEIKRQLLSRWHKASNHDLWDWMEFEPLIGHGNSARARRLLQPLRRFKAAQIADLIEDASTAEGREILDFVHEDPDFEADVFEEVDPPLQTRLLTERDDAEIAAVLARMQADDAADAITDLPQERRLAIIGLLPDDHRRKVLTLLGFNSQTAGGLMAPECISVPEVFTVTEALAVLKESRGIEGVGATTLYAIDGDGRLTGASPLVTLVRADPAAPIGSVAEVNPVRVRPEVDVIEVALVMSDYNLTLVPVVDDQRRILGIVTVDDVLEATIPTDWRRRGPVTPGTQELSPSPEQ